IASARLPRPSDHPVRGLDRDYGPPPRPPTGPRQARDDPCGSHRARTRGGRDPRLDPRPVSRAHGPKRRGTVRRILRHHDGNPLEAYIEGVEGAQGSPHDVRVAARQSDPTNRARQSARRGGSGKGATRGLRPRRLQRSSGQPTSLRSCRSRHFPRPDPARGVAPSRTGPSPADSTDAVQMSVTGSGAAAGTFSTRLGLTPASGRWLLTGEESLESAGLKVVSSVLDLEANGTFRTSSLPIPFLLSVQNTTSFRFFDDPWRFPAEIGNTSVVTGQMNFSEDSRLFYGFQNQTHTA